MVLFTAFRRRSGSNCVRISQLEGKRVALWGWGREGRAAYRALRARDDQPATVGKRPGFGNGDSEGLAAGELTLFCSPGEAEEVRSLGDARDRKSVVEGTSVSVRVDLGGRRISKNKTATQTSHTNNT